MATEPAAAGRRPRVLILAFSPLRRDARVLRQIRLLAPRYEVTTLGYGEAPDGVADHLRLPDDVVSWHKDRRLLMTRRFRSAYDTAPVTVAARRLLAGHRTDVVLADDIDTVPLALELTPAGGVHADLHEYHPRQNEELRRWRWFVAPYYRWLVRTFGTRADSVTTVAAGIAAEYRREFGIEAGVVTNAAAYVDLAPGPVGEPLRLVHSGNAQRHRLDVILEAMELVRRPMTLDLYLVANDPGYLGALRSRYAAHPRVRVHEPVSPEELPATLNRHDVGVYVLPPVSFNHRWALPNKVFDFVQGRLGLVVGPSPEMAALVREHGVGVVTEDFSAPALARALDALTPEAVAGFKAASHRSARELSAEAQAHGWSQAVDALARRAGFDL